MYDVIVTVLLPKIIPIPSPKKRSYYSNSLKLMIHSKIKWKAFFLDKHNNQNENNANTYNLRPYKLFSGNSRINKFEADIFHKIKNMKFFKYKLPF